MTSSSGEQPISEFEASIRRLILSYLDGEITASALNDSLPDGWILDEACDVGATKIVLSAVGYLAGYQASDRSENDLREALRLLIEDTIAATPWDPKVT